jgi:hypothetical protein
MILKRLTASPRPGALAVSLLAFVVYLLTLAPTVDFIDSGELSAVACTLGIAHPTGYPLFTLLGWVFSRLPVAAEEVLRLNVMAATLCAAGLFFFYHIIHLLLSWLSRDSKSLMKIGKEQLSTFLFEASAGATLLLAFSETYWSQALSVEVYSLHLLLLSMIVYTFLKAVFHGSDRGDPGGWKVSAEIWWVLFAFILGLSFTNHMTTVLLAPGLLFLYFAAEGFSAQSWKRLATLCPPFALGLSVYLYLPFRAGQSPALNWGNPATLERFLWHLSGKQYRVWIFSSTEAASRQLKYFMTSLPDEFAYIGLLLAVVGVVMLLRTNKKLFAATSLLFVGCVFYSINYDIHDIDSYFLLAYVCVALWAGCGFLLVIVWMVTTLRWRSPVIAGIILGLGLVPLFAHYKRVDESRNYLVHDYTMNMFASLEPNALVLSYQWDYWVSAANYFQLVKGLRPDVVVVDKELLRRSWYLTELGYRFPWLIHESQSEVNAFQNELSKFEHEQPYNPAVIQARYEEMIRSFIKKSFSSRPVYVTAEIESEFTRGFERVPQGLAFRIWNDTLFHPTSHPEYAFRPLGRSGRLESFVPKFYASSLIARGEYYLYVGRDRAEGEKSFVDALRYDPSSAEAKAWIQRIRK